MSKPDWLKKEIASARESISKVDPWLRDSMRRQTGNENSSLHPRANKECQGKKR